MQPVPRVEGPVAWFLQDDVDTDQIVPARYLTGTSREGLGRHAFADVRARPGFPRAAFMAARSFILVAGANFGCGSSREHAVWALLEAGVRAVVAPSFGDIFRRNAGANGLVAAVVGAGALAGGTASATRGVVDVERGEVRLDGRAPMAFTMDGFTRRCLLEGVDELGYLLARREAIERFERGHQPGPATTVEPEVGR